MGRNWKKSFGSHLKTEDLDGRACRVEIERIEEDGGADVDHKPIAYLRGRSKDLVLNKTKCEALADIAGSDDMDEWEGLVVVLQPGTTRFQGKTVPCIDIRANRGSGGSAAPSRRHEPDMESEPPPRRTRRSRDEEPEPEPADDQDQDPSTITDDDIPF